MLFAVAATICGLAVQAESAKYYWTHEGEGNWGDATKWHKGTKTGPTGELPGIDDDVFLYASTCTINVDSEYEVAHIEGKAIHPRFHPPLLERELVVGRRHFSCCDERQN